MQVTIIGYGMHWNPLKNLVSDKDGGLSFYRSKIGNRQVTTEDIELEKV